jgi:glycerate kinase
MQKVILAPDSFKGTMSSTRVCQLMETQIRQHFPAAVIKKIPVADGGEGTVECFLEAVGGQRIAVKVKGPYFEALDAFYGRLADGETAVIEMAAAAGLPLVELRPNPALTTTYGVGQLIKHAVESGCRKIIIGLGGSCTNDGGCGLAAALGARFLDRQNREFVPVGGTLDQITAINTSGMLPQLVDCDLIAMCDVDNPLYGVNGAARIYGPQKGADPTMVELLDQNLTYLGKQLQTELNLNVSELPGAGAAGGMGAGVVAFLGAQLRPGIDTVLDTVDFATLLTGTDLIFTGEGRIDGQSLRGKVVSGIAKRAGGRGIPVIAVVGDIGAEIDRIYHQGVTAVVSINRVAVPFETARLRCEQDLSLTMDTIMRLLKLGR